MGWRSAAGAGTVPIGQKLDVWSPTMTQDDFAEHLRQLVGEAVV